MSTNCSQIEKFIIKTSDQQSCELIKEIVTSSEYFRDQIEILEFNGKLLQGVIELTVPHTMEEIKFFEFYANKIHEEEKEFLEVSKEKLVEEFNTKVSNLDKQTLDKLIKIVDYLGHETLLNRICDGIVKFLVKNKEHPEVIRKHYGLEDDLTDEEKDEIKKNFGFLFKEDP